MDAGSAPHRRSLKKLDGTPSKGRLGANAILGVSLAVAKRRGSERTPALSLSRGAMRPAARADDEPSSTAALMPTIPSDIQEFMIMPGRRLVRGRGAYGLESSTPCARAEGCGPSTNAATRAARAHLKSAEEELSFIMSHRGAGYKPGEDVASARLRATDYKGQVSARRRGKSLDGRGMDEVHRSLVGAFLSVGRGRHGRGRLAGLEDADRSGSAAKCQLAATTCSSQYPSAWPRASSRDCQLDPGGRSTRSARHPRRSMRWHGATLRLYGGDLASLGETEDNTIADIAVATNAGRSDRLALGLRSLAKYNS